MNLITEDYENVLPCKTLHKLPSYLDEKEVQKQLGNTVRVIDLGNLTSFQKMMLANTDYRHPKLNASMSPRDWAGTPTWEKYLELLENGDTNVMNQIKTETGKQVAQLSKKYEDTLSRYKFDVSGQFFDVGLVLSGIPETWLEPIVEKEPVVKVSVLINGAFNHKFNKDDVVKNASRILGMIKILEDHGVQIQLKMLTGCQSSSYRGSYSEGLITLINLKEYDDPINYKKLSALLTPATLRRGTFKIMEMQAADLRSGYGVPHTIDGHPALNSSKSIDELEAKLFKKETK